MQISVQFVGFVTLSPGQSSLKEAVGQHEAPKNENDNLYGSRNYQWPFLPREMPKKTDANVGQGSEG